MQEQEKQNVAAVEPFGEILWQGACRLAGVSLRLADAREMSKDDIIDALGCEVDQFASVRELAENLTHIREYFALAPRESWTQSDRVVAITRLQATATADPMEWAPVAGQAVTA